MKLLIVAGISTLVLAPLEFHAKAQQTNGIYTVQTNILDALSPKLTKFLADNSSIRMTLSNACAAVFPGKRVSLFYFYSRSDSVPRAHHYYPSAVGQADVVICVRENQEPCDELISLLYEILNSRHEEQFQRLFQRARAGTVSKEDFANEIDRAEFQTVKDTRDVVRCFRLSRKERARSHYYSRFVGAPDDYKDLEAYAAKVSPGYDTKNYYQQQYDVLRKIGTGDQQ